MPNSLAAVAVAGAIFFASSLFLAIVNGFFGFCFCLAYYFTTTSVCEKEKRAEKPIRQLSRILHQGGGLLGPSRSAIIRCGGFCSLSLSKCPCFLFFWMLNFGNKGCCWRLKSLFNLFLGWGAFMHHRNQKSLGRIDFLRGVLKKKIPIGKFLMGLMMIHKPYSDLLLVPSSVCCCGCSSLVSCSCSFQGIVYE